MASIGPGSVNTDQTSTASTAVQLGNVEGEVDAPPVNRGFSDKNSYSRVEGDESVRSQVPTPSLDEPKQGAESDKAANEILQTYEKDKDKSVTETLKESVESFQKNPLSKQTSALQNRKGELASQGFNESQIEGMMALADPTDENNSLSSMHSSSARVKDMIDGEGKVSNLFRVFEDVLVKYSAITHIPDDLKTELDADFAALTKAAFSADAPLDIDSATTMLVEIQSKLQNERLVFDQETIKIGQLNIEQRASKIIHKIRDSIEKVEKAKQSQLIGKIFGWIAVGVMAIATAIVAVVGAVFTGGVLSVVAVSMMIAATAVIMTMMISSETGDWMNKIFDSFAGEDKSKARMAAMIFWTAIVMILSIGGAVAGGFAGAGGAAAGAGAGVASGVSGGATATATAANSAASAASTAAKLASMASKFAKVLQVIQGAATVADGASGVANAAYNYEADILRAEALEEKGEMLRLQQMVDDAIEAIQQAIDELQSGYSVAANIIKANHDTKTTLARNLRA